MAYGGFLFSLLYLPTQEKAFDILSLASTSSNTLAGKNVHFQVQRSEKANLAAFLTVTQMEKPIQSFQDLSLQTDMLYGTVSQTSIHDYLKLKANQVLGLYL